MNAEKKLKMAETGRWTEESACDWRSTNKITNGRFSAFCDSAIEKFVRFLVISIQTPHHTWHEVTPNSLQNCLLIVSHFNDWSIVIAICRSHSAANIDINAEDDNPRSKLQIQLAYIMEYEL
jgi:hypothetical protein